MILGSPRIAMSLHMTELSAAVVVGASLSSCDDDDDDDDVNVKPGQRLTT